MLSPTWLGPASNVIDSVHRASIKPYQCNTPLNGSESWYLREKNAALKERPPIYLYKGYIFGNANRKEINYSNTTAGSIHLPFVPKSELGST